MKAIFIIATSCFTLLQTSSAQDASTTLLTPERRLELQQAAREQIENLVAAAQAFNAMPEQVRKSIRKPTVAEALHVLRLYKDVQPGLVLTDEVGAAMKLSLVLSEEGKLRGSETLNMMVQEILAERSVAKGQRTAQTPALDGIEEMAKVIAAQRPAPTAEEITRAANVQRMILAKTVIYEFLGARGTQSTEIDDVKTLEDAIERMNHGVKGGGAFKNGVFQVTTTPEEAAAISSLLVYDQKSQTVNWSAKGFKMISDHYDAAKKAKDVKDQLNAPRGIQGTRVTSADSDAAAKRTAQSVASVFNAVMATETKELDSVTTVEEAIQRMNVGVKGGGAFSERTFMTKTPPEQVAAVKRLLRFNVENRSLEYVPPSPESSVLRRSTSSDSYQITSNTASQTAERNAQRIAAAFNTALAAGSEELGDVNTVEEAIQRMNAGVSGQGAFAGKIFSAPTTPEQAAAAKRYLKWDAREQMLQFTR